MKKYSIKIVIYIMLFMLIFTGQMSLVWANPFDVDARSAILMDPCSGKVIYEKNPNDKLPPASVTKIMTMLITMEEIDSGNIDLTDKVTISEHASSMGGSQLYMEPGEVRTVEELMKGIAVASANDGCVAMAEFISGSEEVFVKRMNDKAKELGMNNTQFMNTNGLPEEGHYTTAYDIALMSKELLKHPKIHKWLTIWMDTLTVGLPNKKKTVLQLTNTNKLIRFYKGANGIKTGYTSDAKYCLSASAKKNGFSLIAIILGSPTSKIRFAEASKLLNYGFSNYSMVNVAKKNQIMGQIRVDKGKVEYINVIAKDNVGTTVKKGQEKEVHKEVVIQKSIKAPLKAGSKVGYISLSLKGKEITKIDLVAEKDVKKANILDIFTRLSDNLL
ncbi:MAG: D-alanyl-D-alanine carboxypeptidase [Anaeromicrobium sp.]|uniref:D-alanyl-D-alanine carboxypeptidase family protein n=1 Tax=Anaeromicrobium sp. TaxID=1929132 RepID=UPI0025E45952|nr:D-alanyl-D-alanine carboxypeptidase family protein [Anaeromicrobium sp.]MCT4594686.1 D-alanyl-D-alanine carboxypeptidase [Anaeromicrobium sp.]